MDISTITSDIERFLYDEALLLEERQLDRWLTLWDDECRYRIPMKESVQRIEPTAESRGMPLVDEDKEGLATRVKWILEGLPHSDMPPTATTRLVTNVRVEGAATLDHPITVTSRFIVHQLRTPEHEATFIGARRDLLRSAGSSWLIKERVISLAQPVLKQPVTIFF